jgi:phospholipid/cholesterol/gamma-HCH transport system substrate-binding protein
MRRSKIAAVLTAGSLLLSGCGFHGLYGVTLPGGASLGSHPYSVNIYFANVLDLVPQSAVKVNDVAIGRVESVSLSKAGDPTGASPDLTGWLAKVVVQVRGDIQLPTNARAEIMQTSLLGEKYVALEEPLVAPAPTQLRNGSTIAYSNTKSAYDVEQVLGALSALLNGGGLPQLKVITTELNNALDGNSGAIRDLLNQLNSFVGTLNVQKSSIINTLDSLNRLSATLAAQDTTLAKTLDTLPKALAILAADRSKFTTLLTSLSHLGAVASDVISQTDTDLTSALINLSPALEQLAAAGSNLPKALQVAGTFPFPLGKTLDAVKGDYANLHLYLDLNITDELCGLNSALNAALCSGKTGGLSASAAKAATASAAALQADAASTYQPSLLGLSG